MITIETNNLGVEMYWKKVYTTMNISMFSKFISFLQSWKIIQTYRIVYSGRVEIKKKLRLKKIKELMEKQ